jgi:predicted amidohydrolase YtcJ
MQRIAAAALATLLCVACSTTHPDLIITNGRVFTADDAQPWAEAVAIRGERIAAVGTSAAIRATAGPQTEIVDAGGRLVVPGLNDAHVHSPWSAGAREIALPPDAAAEAVVAAVRAAAQEAPEGTWLEATIAPPLLDDPTLTRAALDAAAPRHPVALGNLAGHARLLNSAALRAWRIGENDPDPKGGRYGRSDGRLNGWVYEHALWTHDREAAASVSDEVFSAQMRAFAEEVLRYGITSVQSMPMLPVARAMRLRTSVSAPLRWRWMEFQLAEVDPQPRGPVKYILDGTPVERGAALRAPYADAPGSGVLNYSDEELRAMVETAARSDQQLLLHIAGDLPLQKLFALMSAVPADWPSKRLRIEHGDFLGDFLDDAARFQVVHVINPSHYMLPEMMSARFGTRYPRYLSARSVLERGIPLAIGSDGPLNPWLNMMFAEMHPGNPAEALTREQTLIAYTRGSAFAERLEHQKGTITRGKLADLAVLSQDVFTVPLPELPKTESVLTIVGGRIVRRAL